MQAAAKACSPRVESLCFQRRWTSKIVDSSENSPAISSIPKPPTWRTHSCVPWCWSWRHLFQSPPERIGHYGCARRNHDHLQPRSGGRKLPPDASACRPYLHGGIMNAAHS